MKNAFEKLNPKTLSTISLALTALGMAVTVITGMVESANQKNVISEMVKEEVAKLNN